MSHQCGQWLSSHGAPQPAATMDGTVPFRDQDVNVVYPREDREDVPSCYSLARGEVRDGEVEVR
jgi:hypothetical protein